MLCTKRGDEDTVKSSKILALMEIMVLWRRQTIKKQETKPLTIIFHNFKRSKTLSRNANCLSKATLSCYKDNRPIFKS